MKTPAPQLKPAQGTRRSSAPQKKNQLVKHRPAAPTAGDEWNRAADDTSAEVHLKHKRKSNTLEKAMNTDRFAQNKTLVFGPRHWTLPGISGPKIWDGPIP
eukprot:COSAG02_NODE_5934_length_3932_cov_6.030524_1_plen_101_part_00